MLRIFRGINFVVEYGLDVCYAGDGVAVGVLVTFELWGWTGGFWARVFREGGWRF